MWNFLLNSLTLNSSNYAANQAEFSGEEREMKSLNADQSMADAGGMRTVQASNFQSFPDF